MPRKSSGFRRGYTLLKIHSNPEISQSSQIGNYAPKFEQPSLASVEGKVIFEGYSALIN